MPDVEVPQDLLELSRKIGDPANDLAMLAEGNTSQTADDDSFWVKASGVSLQGITAAGFVRVAFKPILDAMSGTSLTDAGVREVLKSAVLQAEGQHLPSVETFMHAFLLRMPDVCAVAHAHPTPILSLLCLEGCEEWCEKRLFPDEIVCCGPATCFVDYVDPGLPLAQEISRSVLGFVDRHGYPPKLIWMRNHGAIALGKNAKDAESCLCMAAKAARVWLGMLSSGRKPRTLTSEQIARIHTRPDEHYRQRLLWATNR